MTVFRMLLRQVLPTILGLWLMTGCVPSQVLLIPADAGGGRAVNLISHPDSVYVRFLFVRADDKELVFQAEFSNASNHPVSVNPAEFYYLPLADSTVAPASPAPPAFTPDRRPARDPEGHLAALAALRDEEAAKSESVSFLEILAGAANLMEDIASIKKKETDAQIAERDNRHRNDNINFDNERAGHADNAQTLHAGLTEQATTMLRPATLQTGDQVAGFVYFPRLDVAPRLRFLLFFDKQPVQFDFTQEILKPNQR